jgi:hypothetical protein
MVETTKDRTQTHVGREIETALTSLNDQHAYFLFLEFQFLEQIRGLTITSATKVTTEAFPRNRYAPKIRVRIRDLEAFLHEAEAALYAAKAAGRNCVKIATPNLSTGDSDSQTHVPVWVRR